MQGPGAITPQGLGSIQLTPSTASGAALLRALAGQELQATLLETQPQGVKLLLPDGKEVLAQGRLPFPEGSLLTLKALPLPGSAGLQLQVIRATPPPPSPVLAPLAHGEAAQLLTRLQAPGAALKTLAALLQTLAQAGAAEKPAAWSTWMKEAMRVLSDPAASPEEAAFHRLQAKEGTALFELPQPWAPGSGPMHLWVEEDAQGAALASGEGTVRIFLSVPFSSLGDVRLGLEQSAAGLRARVWLNDPGLLEPVKATLEAELAALGRPVSLQIIALPPEAPSLQAMAGAPILSALG